MIVNRIMSDEKSAFKVPPPPLYVHIWSWKDRQTIG